MESLWDLPQKCSFFTASALIQSGGCVFEFSILTNSETKDGIFYK